MTVLGELHLQTVEDVAAFLSVSPVTYREWWRRGFAPGIRMPGTRRILVPQADLEAHVAGVPLEVLELAAGGRIVRPKASAGRKRVTA